MKKIAAVLLLLCVAPLRALEVSRPTEIAPAPYNRFVPAIATNGDGYLVVWSDARPTKGVSPAGFHPTNMLRGMLLDAEGRPRTPHDFPIAPTEFGMASVASNGTGYLVAATEAVSFGVSRTRLVAVTADGRIRSGSVVPDRLMSLTGVGCCYYAVMKSGTNAFGYSVAVFSADGRMLQDNVPIANAGVIGAVLYGTFDGRLLASWRTAGQPTRAAFVSAEDLLERHFIAVTAPQLLSRDEAPQSIVETPHGFVLMWWNAGLATATLDTNGALLTDVTAAYTTTSTSLARNAVVLSAGEGLVAVEGRAVRVANGQRTSGVGAMRLDAAGRPLGGFEFLDREASRVAAAPDRDGGGVVAYLPDYPEQVHVRRVLRSGEIGADTIVSQSLPTQESAVIKRCGRVSFVAWAERTGVSTRILYRRFDAELRPLDPPNTVVATTQALLAEPGIACGSTTALLLWQDGPIMRGLLFDDPRGTPRVLELGPRQGGWNDEVLFDGTGYVFVTGEAIERWSESGQLLLSSPHAAGGITTPILGWNGQEFLLAGGGTLNTVVARRLDFNFSPIGRDTTLIGDDFLASVQVAASDEMWMFAWKRNSEGVRSLRMTAQGVLLDPIDGIPTAPADHLVQVSWNGSAFEIFTERTVITRTPSGDVATYSIFPGAGELLGIEPAGALPLMLYWRNDPLHGVRRLFVDPVARSWAPPPVPRRRSARH